MSRNSKASKISKAVSKKEWSFPVANLLQSGMTDQEIEAKNKGASSPNSAGRTPYPKKDAFGNEENISGSSKASGNN